MRRYEEGLAAYTYRTDDDAVFGAGDFGNGLPAVQLPLPLPAPGAPAPEPADSPAPPA